MNWRVVLTVSVAAFASLSLVLSVWQWAVARRFPLHRRTKDDSFAPGISILKPLKGCDGETKACLASWFDQTYPGPVQLLFGVASPEDPVCSIVRELIAAYPDRVAQLLICDRDLGPNAKVSTLVQLRKQVLHELMVISDADVLAPSDLLVNLVAPLRDRLVGLVNCFYKLANPSTHAMECEAIAVNADFWSHVLQAQSIKPLEFALGAVMATRVSLMDQIGGVAALLKYLADDYQLGHRIAQQGQRIALCPVVVECRSDPMGWKAVWNHQLRWARTIRVCQPGPFFLSILANGTLWPIALLAVAPSWIAAVMAVGCCGVRVLTAQSNQRRLTGSRLPWRSTWLIPAKDLLSLATWLLAFTGSRIEWRGRRYQMLGNGTLKPI